MIELLHPKRAAHAAIRGYLYQAAVAVERWLALGDGEILLCEGDEDLDKLTLAGGAGESEQLKSYSGRLGWGSEAVGESVINFLRAFVVLRQRGERRTFLFTTTAELKPNTRGFDVLGSWHDPGRRDEVVAAIRKRVSGVADAELAWLDADASRWLELVAAVQWRFGAPDLEEVQRGVERTLGERFVDEDLAALIAPRLLAESLRAHTQQTVDMRMLDRARLLAVLGQSREQLQTWAAGQEKLQLDALRAGIRDELREHDLEREAAALAELLHSGRDPIPADGSPAALLRAGAEVVSFSRRVEELQALDAWFESDAPAAVWLWTGGGGTGKTRLFVEWVKRLRDRGVRAGFLKKEVTELAPLFGALGPRVVVVDYAENRLGEVREILGRLAEDEAERGRHRPFRLVLLARGVGEWWEGLAAEDYRRGVLLADHGRVSTLDALVPETDDRYTLYGRAIEELAARLPATAPAPAPSLDAPHFAQGLYVLMAALAALAGKSVADADELLDFMLEHERRYWQGAAMELELAGAVKNAFVRSVESSVVLLTLWGGRPDRSGVRDVVERTASLSAGHEYLRDELVDVLRRLYGGDHGTRGLEPDLIGEHLVQRALEGNAGSVLRPAVEGAGAAESTSFLTVLDRLAKRRPEAVEWLRATLRLDLAKLAMPAIEVALATGDPMGLVLAVVLEESGSVPVAEAIVTLVDERHEATVVLRETAATATRIALDARRGDGEVDRDAVETARLASNLGVRLSALGRREAALEAAQGAVELYRKLAEERPVAFLPALALSLNNLGDSLSALGRRDAALETTQEALQIRRQLAEQRPDTFLPDLATSLINLGSNLSALGRREAALEAAQEAVEYCRQLAKQRPDAFLADLAASLNNLGKALSELGRHEAALESAQEAVGLNRQLAEQRPDAFLPDLAQTLNNFGSLLSAVGRREAALEAAQEAVDLRRQLAEQRPDAFLPGLATSLNNLGNRLSVLGRREEALEAAHEAVELRRRLAEQRPDAFLPDLATSFGALGTIFLSAGDSSIARNSFASGIRALGPLFLRSPAAHGILMGKLVTVYMEASHESGQEPDDELLAPILALLELGQETDAEEPP